MCIPDNIIICKNANKLCHIQNYEFSTKVLSTIVDRLKQTLKQARVVHNHINHNREFFYFPILHFLHAIVFRNNRDICVSYGNCGLYDMIVHYSSLFQYLLLIYYHPYSSRKSLIFYMLVDLATILLLSSLQ